MNELIGQTITFAISRYFHLLSVIIAIGGAFIIRYAVQPALSELDQSTRGRFLDRMGRALARIVPAAVLLLILTGLINVYRAFTVAPMPPPAYHMILGLKILLSFMLFGIALGMAWGHARIQANRRFWYSMMVHMGLLLVALSVALRFLSGK